MFPRRWIGAVGALVLPTAAVLVAACGGAAPAASSPASSPAPTLAAASTTTEPPTPQASPSPSAVVTAPTSTLSATVPPASPEVFTSSRYGYSITLTSDWIFDQHSGTWDGRTPGLTRLVDPGTDVLSDPGVASFELGLLPVQAGTTVDSWEASEAEVTEFSDCQAKPPAQKVTVGKLPALILEQSCPVPFVLNLYMVRGSSGMLVEWESPKGNAAADQATFLAILGTLKFH